MMRTSIFIILCVLITQVHSYYYFSLRELINNDYNTFLNKSHSLSLKENEAEKIYYFLSDYRCDADVTKRFMKFISYTRHEKINKIVKDFIDLSEYCRDIPKNKLHMILANYVSMEHNCHLTNTSILHDDLITCEIDLTLSHCYEILLQASDENAIYKYNLKIPYQGGYYFLNYTTNEIVVENIENIPGISITETLDNIINSKLFNHIIFFMYGTILGYILYK